MEDKKLDFNQPLLSVRRCAVTLPSDNIDARKTGNSHLVVPRLPLHRPELKSGPITNPGSVPFHWERTPGQPKQVIRPKAPSIATLPVGPKLPPGRYRSCKNGEVNVSARDYKGRAVGDGTVKHVEKSGETMEEKDSGSVASDGAYMDALDWLSATDHQSFFLNCSMSELDDLDNMEPSVNFSSMDPQNRAFMMDRFLPAAKAMASASEMKPHPHRTAPKKPPEVVEERPEHVKQRISSTLRYGPNFAMQYSHFDDNRDEEDSDDEYDHHGGNLITTACGLLPQFCLKSSFGLLNPVPSLSVRTRTRMAELDQGRTNLGNEKPDRLENHSTSAYCDALVPLSDVEEKGIPVNPEEPGIEGSGWGRKASKTFQELLAEQDSSEESDSGGAVVEKTLYVDTIQKVESPYLRPCSPDAQNPQDGKGTLSTREETGLSIQDLKTLDNAVDGEEKSNDTCRMDMPTVFCPNIEQPENKDSKGLQKLVPRSTALKLSHQFPASPPLPKSPSNSWLGRTLPSKPTKNPTLRSYLGATTDSQNHSSKAPAPSDHTKWETLVKTTQVKQHRQLNHSESEGLLMTIPET